MVGPSTPKVLKCGGGNVEGCSKTCLRGVPPARNLADVQYGCTERTKHLARSSLASLKYHSVLDLQGSNDDSVPKAPQHKMQKLADETLRLIFRNLSPEDAGRSACVQKSWRELIQEDDLWQHHCEARWSLTDTFGPERGGSLGDFRSTFASWQQSLGRYGPAACQARSTFSRLEKWTQKNVPDVYASLRPGATEEDLNAAEASLGLKLPAALDLGAIHSLLHGLFGGYTFYEYLACGRFLSLAQSIALTAQLQAQFAKGLGEEAAHEAFRHLFLIASAYQPAEKRTKVFFIVLHGGNDHEVATMDQPDFLREFINQMSAMNPSDPSPMKRTLPLIPAAPDSSSEWAGQQYSVLRWFRALADQLEAGMLAADQLLKYKGLPASGISLYPAAPPLQSRAVTCGLEIKASAIFVPEQSRCSQSKYHFAYSVRFRLLSIEEQEAMRSPASLRSAQLLTRHWRIHDAAEAGFEAVDGDGVIGQYPLLIAGGDEYVYQSCTACGRMGGWMEGSFTFIEGSLQQPDGPQFDAQCARFPLDRPGFIF
ncbi:hypothetical protein WJX74_002702 [Apatococcus lobatus]|uniref:F-box domain-containing protein n=1 Tax=Apatococcus lobatus TaxID=904363 RepID=A0AAW1SEN0_9CHLO